MDGVILEANGNRVYIRSKDDNDYISSREHFVFDPKRGHGCLISGMPVIFDVGQSRSGRVRAENIKIVDWLYPSATQAELVVVNYGNCMGTASMACGCHVSLYRNQFVTDPQYVDDPAIMCTGARLVADIKPYISRGSEVIRLKAVNIEILVPEGESK
jgi:hypothetical protein